MAAVIVRHTRRSDAHWVVVSAFNSLRFVTGGGSSSGARHGCTWPIRAVLVLAACSLSACAMQGASTADAGAVTRTAAARHLRVCSIPAAVRASAVASTLSPALVAPGFDLRTTDGTLQAALTRWTASSGATLRWNSALQVPVPADTHVAGDLPTAMRSVMSAITEAGYPLTIMQVADGKTWIVTDSNDTLHAQEPSPTLPTPKAAPAGGSDAQIH